ncbi:hypothetical protein J1N35_026768 [Gossypium stocksii]|uniref:Aminotransferase-like plant mobile domain-containing protein n=1 Tax=Gossypium stocksii TaxID=47602 RepID=A0A9D3V9J6_9ROSI|nr:hypothetical protein J1N35_026768 [Gossypium stocksii]
MNGVGYSPDARLMPYLELAGFGSAALTRTFDLRYDLISALVERWRPETYTFHLPCGECTVTLEDVALQFGLPIDGDAVTGVSAIAEPAALCYSLLGTSPGDAESTFSELKFTWLKANFQHLSDNATEEELVCAARAYIMHIIGGVLMPNSNNNRVHLQYLPLLADLRSVRSYSWGSAVLSMLYRELCRTTDPDAVDIGGCLILLQSWALYRMPFLASVTHQPYVYPLVNRWSIYPGIGRSYTVPIYRLLIEQHAEEGFIWTPYRRPEIVAIIPSSAYVDSHLWCTNAPIICFNVVEWYHGDRVLRQFGCRQYIPDLPMQVEKKVHGKNKRGRHGQHWGVTHRRYIAVWESRMARRPQMDMCSELRPSVQYMQWYYTMGKPYLLGGQSTIIPPHVQRSGVYEPVVDIEPDPQPDAEHDPEPDAEHDPEPEPEAQPEAESERSHSQSTDTSYHPDLAGSDYILGSTSHSHSANTSYHPEFTGNNYLPGLTSHSHSADTSYHPDLAGNDYLPGSTSHSHSADTSYHPDLAGNDYLPGSSGGGYHYGFHLFGSYPPQHNTSPGPYPPHYSSTPGPYPLQYSTPTPMYRPQHGTPPGSSSSVPFESHEFFSMYQTPSPAAEEDVGRRNHPQRERRPPQKYTPRMTPSNHQF